MDRPEHRLALIELYERDGRMGRMVDVWQWPLTLGRALDNHVVLDDPHVAAHHAVLSPDEDGQLRLQPLPSRNGVLLDGRRADARTAVPATGATLQLGATRLRLRLPGAVLAPEQLMPRQAAGGRLATAGLLLGVFALLLIDHALSLDPGADYAAWLPALVGLPAALFGWCGLWALMSKLFQHRFDFIGHLRIVLPWMLAMTLAEMLWPQAAAAVAAPWLWKLGSPLQALLAAGLIRAHLAHVLPLHQRSVNLGVAAMLVAGGALSLAGTWRSTDSLSAAPYMSTLPMPALRLAGMVPSATLVQDMAPLAGKLSQRVKKAREDDEDEGEAAE
jgi:hypothetical protein